MVSVDGTSSSGQSGGDFNADVHMGAFNLYFTTGGVLYEDLACMDYKCGGCSKPFKIGDWVVWKVRNIKKKENRHIVLMVPHHGTCARKKTVWHISDEIPELKK